MGAVNSVINFVQVFGVKLRRTGIKVKVPYDPVAECMYYLNCMCSVLTIPKSEEIEKLRKYKKYKSLTHDDRDALLRHCIRLNPDVLLDKVIFQDDLLCCDSRNEFYELSTWTGRSAVSDSFVFEESSWTVSDIMTFKMEWLRNFWLSAMTELIDRQEHDKIQMNRKSAWCYYCDSGVVEETNEESDESNAVAVMPIIPNTHGGYLRRVEVRGETAIENERIAAILDNVEPVNLNTGDTLAGTRYPHTREANVAIEYLNNGEQTVETGAHLTGEAIMETGNSNNAEIGVGPGDPYSGKANVEAGEEPVYTRESVPGEATMQTGDLNNGETVIAIEQANEETVD